MKLSRRQDGIALVVILGVLLVIGAMFALSSLNFATQRVARDTVTRDSLLRAKEALIAYAATDATRPGELPCPDVNDDGMLVINEDFVGSNCVSLIGRLPWITLGLPDLRDDAGERLWYALSNDFHANGTVPLNSDTAFRAGNTSLQIIGAYPAANLVAIVFSPGAALTRQGAAATQNRSCIVGTNCNASLKCTAVPASNTPKCNAVNYLDVASGEDNSDIDANRSYVATAKSETFNDQLLPIHSDDIMRLVERRAAREFAQYLRDHYDAWENTTVVGGTNKGFYPYAAPFTDPSTTQVGTNGTMSGLLPLANTPLTWSNASLGCTGNGTATLDCNTLVVCLPLVGCVPPLSARVNNVATRFVDPPTPANVQVLLGLSLGGSATWTMNKAQQRLDFSYAGFLSAGTIHIQVAAPAVSSWIGSSWLTQNNWHQDTYYALAPGYAIDGVDMCGGAGPPCLTIANTVAPNDNKQALVVMSGRALTAAGQMVRPVSPLPAATTQFFEGLNPGGTLTFEANARTGTFNDTPLAVRP